MALSVVDPISPAIERTKKILFQPFDITKWFVLGFCAFLAELGGNGPGGGTNFNCNGNPFGGRSSGGDLGDFAEWVDEHLALVILLVAGVIAVVVGLYLLFTWLGSRGDFMLLDGVVHNRAEVKRPWTKFARLANSLFVFRFLFVVVMLLLFLIVISGSLALAWPDIKAETFTYRSAAALAGGIPLVIILLLVQGAVNLALHDFVVPIMYLRGITVIPAWVTFRESMLNGHIGLFILYWLFQIVIGIAIGMIAMVIVCGTLCLAALPYLGSVFLLPLTVFYRSYSLYFIEQFGPEWQVFSREQSWIPDEHPERFGNPDDDRFYRA